ncbi:hypothetical protein CAPTEDRAFT_197588, partial [Capitella teleta]
FESSPGLVKVHEGDDADLIWTTNEDITPADLDRIFYHTSVHDDNNKLMDVIPSFGRIYTFNECAGHRCVLLNGTHETGIQIPRITTADARSKYIIFMNVQNGALDGDAAIYVYQTPDKAELSSDSDDAKEGDDLRLTCASTSNSLPEDNRPQVKMTYKWTLDDQDISESPPDRHSFEDNEQKVLKISDIVRGDSTSSYECIGQEEGSRLESDANGKNLKIENLNVDEDEGDYECYVENDVAQGTSATHTLTVNSVPGVERDLDSEKSVVNTDDSFSVSCAFRAKPAVSVVWKREDGSALPSHIFSFSSSQEADGKFTVGFYNSVNV